MASKFEKTVVALLVIIAVEVAIVAVQVGIMVRNGFEVELVEGLNDE